MNERPFTVALPDIADARLPTNYAAARKAIQACAQIDECKDWADKAAALASYAKQADDKDLLKKATKIKARAIRRCGELLEEIEPKRGANQNITAAGDTKVPTRKDAAEDAGLSPRQAATALRVANVPAEDFDRQVESDNPPTVTELAKQGTKHVPKEDILEGRDPEDFYAATVLLGHLDRMVAPLEHIDLVFEQCAAWTNKSTSLPRIRRSTHGTG